MNQRDRLIDLLQNIPCDYIRGEGDDCGWLEMEYDEIADYLLDNGVIVLPCRAAERIKRKSFAEGEWDCPEIMQHFTRVE